jgi:hypothetical protein
MPKIILDYFGMEGQGRTVTEAKEAAGRKIRAALEGDYAPYIVAYRNVAAVVFRSPDGWGSRLISDDERGLIGGRVDAHCRDERADALRSACLHVAQTGWRQADGLTVPDIVAKPDRRQFLTWASFQLRYQYATKGGLDNYQAHDWAGRNPATFGELCKRVPDVSAFDVPAAA